MASASFTRDEVILALDVLYSSETGRVTADSDEIKELSLLLNRLPIHPLENRRPDFRNAQGIRNQLMLFRSSYKMGKKDPNVGTMFYDVAIEFEGRKDELHLIAETIRRNEQVLCATFHPSVEIDNFSEGVLLEHLHRTIEWRDGAKLPVKDRCEVCNSNPVICYHNSGQLLQNHLVVAPTLMDFSKKYSSNSFLTVCPNLPCSIASLQTVADKRKLWRCSLLTGDEMNVRV